MTNQFNFQDDNIEVKGYIDKEAILNHITEEEIFESVFGFIPVEHEYICSPLREDKNPGAFFQRSFNGSKLIFTDWADAYRNHYDCFGFIQRYYRLDSFYKTLIFIGDTLLKGKSVKRNPIQKSIKTVEKRSSDVTIVIEARPFNNTDGIFWSKYGISKKNLVKDKVFAVSRVLIKNSRRGDREIPLYTKCYAYTDFPEKRKKLYLPYSKNKNRFISTCIKEDIQINHLIDAPQIMLTKSYKDYRVLRNRGVNVTWLQNEGSVPDNLKELVSKYKDVVIFFDNDSAGLAASEKLVRIIGDTAREIYLPLLLLEEGIKDASDMYLKRGVDELNLFLTRNKINFYDEIKRNT